MDGRTRRTASSVESRLVMAVFHGVELVEVEAVGTARRSTSEHRP
jgi:hypothetical protein